MCLPVFCFRIYFIRNKDKGENKSFQYPYLGIKYFFLFYKLVINGYSRKGLAIPSFYSLDRLEGSFISVEGSKPEIAFSLRSESYARRTHYLALFEQEIEKTP